MPLDSQAQGLLLDTSVCMRLFMVWEGHSLSLVSWPVSRLLCPSLSSDEAMWPDGDEAGGQSTVIGQLGHSAQPMGTGGIQIERNDWPRAVSSL